MNRRRCGGHGTGSRDRDRWGALEGRLCLYLCLCRSGGITNVVVVSIVATFYSLPLSLPLLSCDASSSACMRYASNGNGIFFFVLFLFDLGFLSRN